MMLNRCYCRPTCDNKAIIYAPVILPPNPKEPTDAEYIAANWYRNETQNPPSPPEGKIVVATRYEVEDGVRVISVYEYGDRTYTIEDYDRAMESHLHAERSARGYTTREPDAYLTSSNARWKLDAEDWVAHRDAVMEYALGVMNDVESGKIEPPPLETFIENLPTIEWSFPE